MDYLGVILSLMARMRAKPLVHVPNGFLTLAVPFGSRASGLPYGPLNLGSPTLSSQTAWCVTQWRCNLSPDPDSESEKLNGPGAVRAPEFRLGLDIIN